AIACYFTFPRFEGRGYATRMAEAFIARSRMAYMNALIAVQTLPQESASTTILRRLGFTPMGTVDHPEMVPCGSGSCRSKTDERLRVQNAFLPVRPNLVHDHGQGRQL